MDLPQYKDIVIEEEVVVVPKNIVPVTHGVTQVPITVGLIQQVLRYLGILASTDATHVISIFLYLSLQYATIVPPRMDKVLETRFYL